MFVAKDEHDEVDIVICPLPDCNHIWCKQCQQPIDLFGPKHSCDGSSELDYLMKQNGWKYCPSEPVQLSIFPDLSTLFLFSMQDADSESIGM